MQTVKVDLAERSYTVHIGAGLLSWAAASLFYWQLMDASPVAVQ